MKLSFHRLYHTSNLHFEKISTFPKVKSTKIMKLIPNLSSVAPPWHPDILYLARSAIPRDHLAMGFPVSLLT
jgi:hypothetical protein